MPVFGKKVFTTTKKLNIKNLIHLITSTLCFKGAVTLLNLSVTSCQKKKRNSEKFSRQYFFLSTSFVHDRLHQFDYQYICELSGCKMVKINFERVEYKQEYHGPCAHLRNQFKSIEL